MRVPMHSRNSSNAGVACSLPNMSCSWVCPALTSSTPNLYRFTEVRSSSFRISRWSPRFVTRTSFFARRPYPGATIVRSSLTAIFRSLGFGTMRRSFLSRRSMNTR
eukprot:Amastigsp_a175477_8.p4 type:complete len:106 gc:universal Amastigsp_a175477_8:420-737(+)